MSYSVTSCRCPTCGERAEYDCEEDRIFCEYCQRVARMKEESRIKQLAVDERIRKLARLEAQEAFNRSGRK